MFQRLIRSIKDNPQQIYEMLLLVPTFALYGLLNQYVVSCVETEGPSMQPVFYDGSIALIDRFYYKKFRGLQRNDIIVATSPLDSYTHICKRVLYLPGDVKLVENEFYTEHFKIPENHVWIEGDNKNSSFDSRNHGPLPIELIQGRIVFCLYPFKDLYKAESEN